MSDTIRKKAKELSSYGRYGDSTLLHVHPAEVKGLESLVPGGKLPRNPKTGLPEAFFFLPFLAAAAPAAAAGATAAAAPALMAGTGAALGGAAAGLGAAGAAGAGAAGLGALGAAALPTAAETAGALGAAGAAGAAGATGAGLAAAAPTAAGLGSAGSLAAAIPTTAGTASGIGSLGGTASSLGSLGAGVTTTPAVQSALAAGGNAAGAAGSAAAPAAASTGLLPNGALASPASAIANPANAFGAGAATPLTSGTTAATAADAGAKSGIGGLMSGLGNIDMMKLAPLAMLMPRGGSGGSSDNGKGKKVSKDYNGPDAVFPDEGYRGGIDPEWNYFPRMNSGGLVKGYAGGGIVNLQGAPSVMNQSPAMMQNQAMPQAGMMNSQPNAAMPAGGGGIAQLMQPPAMQAPPAQMDSPYAEPSGVPKASKGASKPGGENDQELIAATVEALQGRSPNPQAVISAFVQTFGQSALQDLVARIQQASGGNQVGGMGAGINDGQSDSVPAMIDGSQPAALSQGEYVIPADVVSHLGNGSTDAGAQQLDNMVGRTRMARGGMVGQPPSINPNMVMPS